MTQTQMPMEPPRYLLVCCEPGLDEARISGLYHAFVTYPGVQCVMDADIAGLPRASLDIITGTPLKQPRRRPPKVKL